MSDEASNSALFPVRIAAKSEIADGIFGFELRQERGAELPEFTPGAHLSVRVPNGLIRKYSLCNSASERDRYVIAVKKERDGRGGSASLVGGTVLGDTVLISPPRNDFPLVESRGGYIFIAGGIGITPIMSMMRTLRESGKRFNLYYCTRTLAATAFAEELSAPELRGRVVIHHDEGDPSCFLDLWPILERPKGQHVYCCGPRPLMDAVRDMTGHWPASAIHFESFADAAPVKPDDKEFIVRIVGSDKAIPVPPGTTILDALRQQGFTLASSCESGSCGTCRTRLLAGEADHRDLVLSESQRGSYIMICVSRAKSDELVLELAQ